MVTGAAAPAVESIEWAGLTAMAKLLTDSARSRLATVPHATLEISDGHNARDILGHGNLEDTITIRNAKRSLESDANSTIPQELHCGNGIHVEGLQQLRQDGRRTNSW